MDEPRLIAGHGRVERGAAGKRYEFYGNYPNVVTPNGKWIPDAEAVRGVV
jgi:hypothetical protein